MHTMYRRRNQRPTIRSLLLNTLSATSVSRVCRCPDVDTECAVIPYACRFVPSFWIRGRE